MGTRALAADGELLAGLLETLGVLLAPFSISLFVGVDLFEGLPLGCCSSDMILFVLDSRKTMRVSDSRRTPDSVE